MVEKVASTPEPLNSREPRAHTNKNAPAHPQIPTPNQTSPRRPRRLQPQHKTARQIELHAKRHHTKIVPGRNKRGRAQEPLDTAPASPLSDEDKERIKSRARMNGIRYDLGTKLAALALLETGKSASQTGRELSVSKQTILEWSHDDDLRQLNSDAISRLKKNFVNLMAKGVDMAAQAIVSQPERVYAQTPKDNAITLGILHQNYRLANDQSTENVSHRGVLEDINAEKNKLVERARLLMQEQMRRKSTRLNDTSQT